MTPPIIDHEIEPHPDNDPSHPIPYPKVLDVVAFNKCGGANLSIVVASPLAGDTRSLTRLLNKIEGYLVHMLSTDFQSAAGTPTAENTSITVVLHPGSASEVYELLERSRDWVHSNNATLVVEGLDVTVN